MNRYREQVAAAVGAVAIHSPTHYTWLGRASQSLGRSIDEEMDDSQRRDFLVATLRDELYGSFYRHGSPMPARRREHWTVSADPWLAAALSQANSGSGTWEPGWRVKRVDGDEAVVASARLRARVRLGDCRARAGRVRPGAVVDVRMPKELAERAPGFYTALSDAPADLAASASIVRVYWNVSRTGAPALVAALTRMLNAEGAPFRLKVADHPFRFERCDSAVLYLDGEVFVELREPLNRVAGVLRGQLRPQIPAFTLELVPGVGLAEQGGDDESFGLRRCGLLADAIVRAHERRIAPSAARVGAVAARFADEGLLIDAPYLEPSLAGRHVL
jgi:hypothetical protein